MIACFHGVYVLMAKVDDKQIVRWVHNITPNTNKCYKEK